MGSGTLGCGVWGSGLEAVKPMVTMGRGGNPRRPNVFGHVRGNRRSVQPFGTSSLRAGGPGKAEAGGLLSHLGCLPRKLGTQKGLSRRPKPEIYSAAGAVSPLAGDREGPVSAHQLLGPRRWSPGRAGPKAEGTYPISCHPGGLVSCLGPGLPWRWSSRGPQRRVSGGPHLEPHVGRQM